MPRQTLDPLGDLKSEVAGVDTMQCRRPRSHAPDRATPPICTKFEAKASLVTEGLHTEEQPQGGAVEGWKMPAQMSSETPVVGRCGAERHHVASLRASSSSTSASSVTFATSPTFRPRNLHHVRRPRCVTSWPTRAPQCATSNAPLCRFGSFCTTSRATCRRRDGTQGLSRPPRARVDTGVRLFSDCLGVIPYWQHGIKWALTQPNWLRGGLGHDARGWPGVAAVLLRRGLARRGLASCLGGPARHAWDNERADECALKGAELHALGSLDVSAVAARSQLVKREARLWCSRSSRRRVQCLGHTPPLLKHSVFLGFSGPGVARDRQARL